MPKSIIGWGVLFYRLQLIEAYGTGMPKIFEAYSKSMVNPKLDVTPNVFKITLPNIHAKPVKSAKPANPTLAKRAFSSAEQVLELAREKGVIDRKDVEKLLGISQTPAGKLLKRLNEGGSLLKSENGKNTKYIYVDK